MAEPPPYPDTGEDTGTPLWVKVFGIVALVLVMLVVIMLIAGGGRHGPGRHLPPGGAGGHTPPKAHGVQQP
jgi:hypothetical protein